MSRGRFIVCCAAALAVANVTASADAQRSDRRSPQGRRPSMADRDHHRPDDDRHHGGHDGDRDRDDDRYSNRSEHTGGSERASHFGHKPSVPQGKYRKEKAKKGSGKKQATKEYTQVVRKEDQSISLTGELARLLKQQEQQEQRDKVGKALRAIVDGKTTCDCYDGKGKDMNVTDLIERELRCQEQKEAREKLGKALKSLIYGNSGKGSTTSTSGDCGCSGTTSYVTKPCTTTSRAVYFDSY